MASMKTAHAPVLKNASTVANPMAHANATFRAAMGVMQPDKPAAWKLARTAAMWAAHANVLPNAPMAAISAAIHVAITHAKMAVN